MFGTGTTTVEMALPATCIINAGEAEHQTHSLFDFPLALHQQFLGVCVLRGLIPSRPAAVRPSLPSTSTSSPFVFILRYGSFRPTV